MIQANKQLLQFLKLYACIKNKFGLSVFQIGYFFQNLAHTKHCYFVFFFFWRSKA